MVSPVWKECEFLEGLLQILMQKSQTGGPQTKRGPLGFVIVLKQNTQKRELVINI